LFFVGNVRSNTQSISFTPTQASTYTISFKATDSLGQYCTITKTVESKIQQLLTIDNITLSKSLPTSNKELTLKVDSTNKDTTCNEPTSYEYNFGDNSDNNTTTTITTTATITTTQKQQQHTYQQDGNYTITIKATSCQNKALYSKTIRVYNQEELQTNTRGISKGWNLMSLGSKAYLLTDELNNSFNKQTITALLKYSNNQWSVYTNDSTKYKTVDKFTTLSSKEGFWLRATENSSFDVITLKQQEQTQTQQTTTTQTQLENGWNLIGVDTNLTTQQLVENSINSKQENIKDKVSIIWYYDNQDTSWKLYSENETIKQQATDNNITQLSPTQNLNGLGVWCLVR